MVDKQWKWFGHAGHFICSRWCQFHLCTQVGQHLISTVGEYVPPESSREISAECRGIKLEGRGDARLADWMKKVGFEEIGCGRTYETMVFRFEGVCESEDCGCGLPDIVPNELDLEGYNDAKSATDGHYAMCLRWENGENDG